MKPLPPPAERASRGDVDGMLLWGVELLSKPDADSHERGLKWLRKAADAWHLPARYELGRLMLEGKFLPRDAAQGEALIRSAAGRVPGAERWVRSDGKGVASPLIHEAAARKGDPEGAYALGLLAVEATGPEARATARRWFRQAAEAGHARAMFRLACVLDPQWYWFHHREEGNETESLRWLEQAVERGVPEAYEDWADAAIQGRREPESVATAAASMQHAAAVGLASAQFRLGQLLLRGEAGATFDVAGCYDWLSRAAVQGHVPAAELLERTFGEIGPPTTPEKLRLLLEQIGLREHCVPAFAALAGLHERGEGGAADLELARRYYRNAAAGGDAESARRLVGIELTLGGADATTTLRSALRAIDQAALEHKAPPDAALSVVAHYGDLARARYELACRLELGDGAEASLPDAVAWYMAAVETPEAGEDVLTFALLGAARLLDADPHMNVADRIRRKSTATGRAGRPVVRPEPLEVRLRAVRAVVSLTNRRFRFWDDDSISPAAARALAGPIAALQAAAAAGDAEACYRLGWLLLEGVGIPRNDRQAERWLEAGFERGSLACACLLAIRLDLDDGDAPEAGRRLALLERLREAMKLVRKGGARGGFPAHGADELEPDFAALQAVVGTAPSAPSWPAATLTERQACRAAAEGGDPYAQLALGRVLAVEGPAEREEGYRWLILAAASGAPGARLDRERLAERLERGTAQAIQDTAAISFSTRSR